MPDDLTRPAPPLQTAVPPMHSKMIGVAAVATMALVLAAMAFTLSFDALRALAIEINVRPDRAWMAPVAIDVAQAAATAAYVIFRVAHRYTWARRYCMALAVVTVALSVVGNSYHSYQLADRNRARITAGELLDFIPQPPAIAAIIAAIFPLLWLALFHLFTMMLQVALDDRAQRRGTTPALDDAASENSAVATIVIRSDPATEADAPAAAIATPDGTSSALHGHAANTTPRGATPGTPLETGDVRVAITDEIPVSHMAADEQIIDATRNGYPQTQAGLHQFLSEGRFTDSVMRVAAMLIDEPHLRQTQVARRLHVDKSTVSRRWRLFVSAAEAEGFAVPPLRATHAPEMVRELQPA